MAHVEFRAIRRSFGAVEVIKPLDLDIQKGEFIVLVGPSGCGKTTTLRIVAGLQNATSGAVGIAGRDVTSVCPGDRGRVVFGIRPEHMRASVNAANLTPIAGTLEPLGVHTLILAHAGDAPITVQVDPRYPATEGPRCSVTLDMGEGPFFDPDSERRI